MFIGAVIGAVLWSLGVILYDYLVGGDEPQWVGLVFFAGCGALIGGAA